ncbi:hypothetical protein M3Y99_01566400 [Aphelenchoides fujianensis]|nr:hypothetical protein M3Y99_01566400 [Aphelenchoides fujianensis]
MLRPENPALKARLVPLDSLASLEPLANRELPLRAKRPNLDRP